MNEPNLTRICGAVLIAALCLLPAGGCGGGSVTTPPEIAPTDTAKLAALLPSGVTMQTPVKPEKVYGESSKTVEDALKNLLATVKDNTIYDALGHKIRFESPSKPGPKSKQAEIVVHLAN